MEVDPALRPDGLDRGRLERRVETGLADDERLRGVDELLELLPVGRVDRRLGTTLERDPLRGLTRDLPVDRTGRRQHLHHLTDVDLREVERRRVELPRSAPPKGNGGKFGGVDGLVVVAVGPLGLRIVGHAVSVWTCLQSPSPAHRVSWGSGSSRCSSNIPTSRASSRSTCASRDGGAGTSSSTGSTSPAPSSSRCSRASTPSCTSPESSTRLRDEALMARVNVEGTRRVLAAAAAVSATRIVRISSATVYGAWPSNPVPLTEDAPLRPNPHFSPGGAGRGGRAPDRRLA